MKNVLTSFKRAVIALCFVTISTTSIFANDYVKFKGWKQAETTHFRFIYEAASEEAAQKYAEIADEAWEKIARIYSMPQEKTNVYVFSRLNIVNAYTFFSPPEIVMFDSPVLTSYFGFRDDWMKIFFTHELIHIANITFEDKKYLMARLLGESFRGSEYSSIPGWALEGLTTVLETELTASGRGRSPYFELDFKAPAMDNNLIPYRLIGTEQEPPSGQIYVMGYLIMRSIADRWGLQALADIERNRTSERNWEQSVTLVTGETPQEIYRKAKIALEKKYANERKIPEGKIISPNATNVYYGKPAIIMDDGSIIALTQTGGDTTSVTLLRPGEKDGTVYYEDTVSDEAKKLKETIIFKSAESIAADKNMTIYSTEAVSRYDRRPYNETNFPLFKWTKEDGSVQLTKDHSSYYQPAVSRDGSLLVAVEQNGLKMRIVKIDTQTGEKSVLFQDESYSFIQPALNDDGTKIAFMILKEDRACIALGDPATGQYKIVNNTDYDFITDPSSPNFNKDGTLTFCSNDRGRLEVYEAKINSDGQTFTCTPVLSDPIAALWAYKNDMAIFYLSESSTGRVIKIKPVDEWGKVPDFDGPSPAGEIMTFGDLEEDYPDFNPYKKIAETAKPSEKSEVSESTEEIEESEPSKPAEEAKPYLQRSKEYLEKLEDLEPAVTKLSNEKRFVPYVTTQLLLPLFNFMEDSSKSYIGLGAVYMGTFPRLQMRQGFLLADAIYYPGAKNFTGEFITEFPLFAGIVDILFSRDSNSMTLNWANTDFKIFNTGALGYTLPIISREFYRASRELDFLAYAGCNFSQSNQTVFSLLDDIPFTKQTSFQTGIDYRQKIRGKKDNYTTFGIINLMQGTWDFTQNKIFLGYEGEISFSAGNTKNQHEISLVSRYTDFPVNSAPFLSRAHFNGSTENCLFPGKILLTYTYTIPGLFSSTTDGSIVAQGLASFGKNTAAGGTPETGNFLNFTLEKKLNLGFELGIPAGISQKIAVGYTGLIDFTKGLAETKWNFYISCKMNWIRK